MLMGTMYECRTPTSDLSERRMLHEECQSSTMSEEEEKAESFST